MATFRRCSRQEPKRISGERSRLTGGTAQLGWNSMMPLMFRPSRRSVIASLIWQPIAPRHQFAELQFAVLVHRQQHRHVGTSCSAIRGFMLGSMRQHTWLTARAALTGKSVRNINTPARAPASMFSAQTPEPLVAYYATRSQEEITRVLFDQIALKLPNPAQVTAPMLVLGAECDACVTTRGM
jgi:hypothetical protein